MSGTFDRLRSRYLGDRVFYKLVFTLALPLILQNTVSTFVNLLDNLMVGQTGTEPMSGVSIVNQLIFVYNLCLFGGVSGAGIFAAQFFGSGNHEGVRHCLRFNVLLTLFFTGLAVLLFRFCDEQLIRLFLHGDEREALDATLHYGRSYLRVMMWGFAPFALTNSYTSVLRVTGDAKLPMRAGVLALTVNLFGNWLLIFGHWGFPAMGVVGAAIATVLSRYVEAALILFTVHRHPHRYPFAEGLWSSVWIPGKLIRMIVRKGLPLLFNELFWSMGITTLTQCYSVRGLTAVAALNINSVALNVFNVTMMAVGNCAGIILGNVLGAGEFERARSYSPKLAALSVTSAALAGALFALCAPMVPRFYNTTEEVRLLATQLMTVCAACLPLHAICHVSYFTLRSGGRSLITILFDSGYTWVIAVPVAWLLIHFTSLPLLTVYIFVNALDILKACTGLVLVKRGIWIRNIVAEK